MINFKNLNFHQFFTSNTSFCGWKLVVNFVRDSFAKSTYTCNTMGKCSSFKGMKLFAFSVYTWHSLRTTHKALLIISTRSKLIIGMGKYNV